MVTAMPRRPSVAMRMVSLAGSMAPRSAWPSFASLRSWESLPPKGSVVVEGAPSHDIGHKSATRTNRYAILR